MKSLESMVSDIFSSVIVDPFILELYFAVMSEVQNTSVGLGQQAQRHRVVEYIKSLFGCFAAFIATEQVQSLNGASSRSVEELFIEFCAEENHIQELIAFNKRHETYRNFRGPIEHYERFPQFASPQTQISSIYRFLNARSTAPSFQTTAIAATLPAAPITPAPPIQQVERMQNFQQVQQMQQVQTVQKVRQLRKTGPYNTAILTAHVILRLASTNQYQQNIVPVYHIAFGNPAPASNLYARYRLISRISGAQKIDARWPSSTKNIVHEGIGFRRWIILEGLRCKTYDF